MQGIISQQNEALHPTLSNLKVGFSVFGVLSSFILQKHDLKHVLLAMSSVVAVMQMWSRTVSYFSHVSHQFGAF